MDLSVLLAVGMGYASSAQFTIAPHANGYLQLIDANGGTVASNLEAQVYRVDTINNRSYPYATVSSGRENGRLKLPPGTYAVDRTPSAAPFGVLLLHATDALTSSLDTDQPALVAAAAMYARQGGQFEQLQATSGRLHTVVDAERYGGAAIVTVAVTDAWSQLPSQSADYIDVANITGKTLEYRRGGTGASAPLPAGASRRIQLPSGNTLELEFRNATDTDAVTLTGDAVRWLM